jgi:hypothetical protein
MDITELTWATFDGNNINDATNYVTKKLPVGTPILAQSTPITSERVDQFPTDNGAKPNARSIPLIIEIKGGSISQLEQWFDTSPKMEVNTYAQPKILVGTDGSAVSWYVYARPTSFRLFGKPGAFNVQVDLFVADPIFKEVTPETDAWSITATGQTNVLTVGGNKYSRPVMVITPTTARTGSYAYKRFVAIANRTNRIYKTAINLIDGNWDTAALVADTSVSNQLNGGIDNVVTTIDIDTAVGGGLPTSGMGDLDTEQLSWTGNSGTQLTGVVRGINGTTAASHLDNAVISVSRIQADGDDVRVFNDETGLEEYRWFGGGGINTSTTRVFSNAILPPKIDTITAAGVTNTGVSGAISNVGSVSTITLKTNATNLAMLKELAKVTYKFVAIDMGSGSYEIFKFTGVTPTTYKITGVTRAQKGTSNASHSDGAVLRHIHGYYLMYGNQNSDAPTTDDSFKPVINLATSTNSSHVYADFFDLLNPNRTCQWMPQVITNTGKLSELYRADRYTQADVASEMGMAANVYFVGTAPRAPSIDLRWSLYHPAGITTVTFANGEKYRFSTGWPVKSVLARSNAGTTASFVTAFTEPKPVVVNTWEALTVLTGAKALGATYLYISLILAGTINALTGNYAALEFADVTLTLDSNNTPLINFAAQENNNYMQPRITNTTTAHWLEFAQPVPLNTTVTIDTENLEAYLADGSPVRIVLDNEARPEWLPLSPGVNNTLQYDEVGVVAVSIDTSWANRNL